MAGTKTVKAMNTYDSKDAKVSALLRDTRTAPGLPPRFQEGVWRRIEAGETAETSFSRLDAFINRLLRPRFAVAAMAVVIVLGSLVGTHEGKQDVRQTAQARYLASEAPNSLH
jgi:hypothetical protein